MYSLILLILSFFETLFCPTRLKQKGIRMKECHSYQECFPLCPTSYLQAAFVLTEALVFSTDSSPTALKK
jgi:hypothetical protein